MNELRTTLIRAIYKNPADDGARLAYADAIQEDGIQNDRDLATVEFIRAACSGRPSRGRMHLAAYEWLHKNWKRLIPDTVALFVTGHSLTGSVYTPMFPSFKRIGREIKCQCPLKNPNPVKNPATHRPVYAPTAHFIFWKGFLIKVENWHPLWSRVCGETVRAEAPMLTEDLGDKAQMWADSGKLKLPFDVTREDMMGANH